MASPHEARQRLADLMEDRRADLRLRWEDVAAAGGISVKVLNDVRNGRSAPRRNTLRGIDAGLQWEPGSAERILDGGGPLAPPAPGPVRDDDPAAAYLRAIPGASDAEIAAHLELHRAFSHATNGAQRYGT